MAQSPDKLRLVLQSLMLPLRLKEGKEEQKWDFFIHFDYQKTEIKNDLHFAGCISPTWYKPPQLLGRDVSHQGQVRGQM